MKRSITFAVAAAVSGSLAAGAFAQEQPEPAKPPQPAKMLTIGDKAPAIDIQHWVKGEPITDFENGKVYVVEFWATWCGPCLASMPHISELQKNYKDYGVTFIGVSDEPLDTVTKFLAEKEKKTQKTWDEIIAYTLTTDPDKSVYKDYFYAASQEGIPCAFIVGKDRSIEWIGHPIQIDKTLDAVVKDTWNRENFKVAFEAQQALPKAIAAKDWPKALEILDMMIEKNPKDISAGLTRFRIQAAELGEYEKAYASVREFVEGNWDDAQALNAIAWTIVDDPAIKERNVMLALGYAMRANKLSGERDPAIIDTLARCYYERGDLVNAVLLQRQAAELAQDDALGQQVRETLKKYEKEAGVEGEAKKDG